MPRRIQPVQSAIEERANTLLGFYIADLKGQKVALLEANEEQELARGAQSGNAQAFEHLVRANLRLVVSLARRCTQGVGRGVPMVELIGEGNVGLMSAARHFDPTRNVRFSTYATPWIAHAMSHCVEAWRGCDGSDRSLGTRRNRRAQGSCSDQPGIPLRIAKTVTTDACSAANWAEYTGDDGAAVRIDVLSDPGPLPDEEAAQRILSAQVREIMNAALTDRECSLVRQRYGMDGGGGCSFSEAGDGMGISRQRAHQIETGAIGKLRQLPQVESLRDWGHTICATTG